MKLDPKVPDFLKQLVVNNNREWFNDNKKLYNEAKGLFEEFIQAQITEIEKFDKQVKGLQAKECSFRIYRDIRFSKDKTPYKIHFGAYMAEAGRKSTKAGYYIHVEPDASIIAGGLHGPQNDVLKAVRTQIFENSEAFKSIIEYPKFKKYFPEIYGEKLKSAPRGFDKNFEDLDLIKYKSYDFFKRVTDEELESDHFDQDCLDAFKVLKPVNDYFNEIVKRA